MESWVIEEKQEGCERSGGLWWAPELERWPRKVRSTKWTARKGGLFYREEQDEADGGRRRWRLQVFICSSMQCSWKKTPGWLLFLCVWMWTTCGKTSSGAACTPAHQHITASLLVRSMTGSSAQVSNVTHHWKVWLCLLMKALYSCHRTGRRFSQAWDTALTFSAKV